MEKQTVYIPNSNGKFLISGFGKNEFVSMKESVYVLTEQELNDVKRKAVAEAWEECSKWEQHNGTALTLSEYIDTHHPLK